jgi:hypothetical protein
VKDLFSIITDQDFEKIELTLKEPNIFTALSIQRKEIRHSNFIAYLLDPNENHGLKDILLKRFLRDIFSDSKAKNKELIDADYLDLTKAEVRREWRNIDILIILEKEVITVENKVDTVDHSNQLQRYRKIVQDAFPDKNKIFVYLTPFGSDPHDVKSRDSYINYSYAQISESIESLLLLYKNSISQKIYFYLEDYLVTIKRELLMNDSLNELALKVYNAHKSAFDFIIENKPDPSSMLYPFFEEALQKNGYIIGSKNKGYIRFTTVELESKLTKTGQGWPNKEVFLFEIEYYWTDKYATVNAVIAPCDDKTRSSIIGAVKKSKNYKEPSGKKWLVFFKKKYNFIASEIINEDESEIKKRIEDIVKDIDPYAKEIASLISNAY